jgi:hypothetical protein
MSVSEKLMAPGVFNVSLNIDLVPNSIVNSIEPWEHIVIMPARVSEDELDDSSMLSSAEYVGIITELSIEDETVEVEGTGLVAYLGDSDTRGLPVAEKGGLSSKRSYEEKTLSFVLDNASGKPFGLLREGDEGKQRAVRAGTITDPSKQDTKLLLNFNGSDGTVVTTDASSIGQTLNFFDSAEISTDQNKFGSSSLYLSGESDHVLIDYNNDLNLDDRDFTIEWWEYRLTP